MIVPEFWAEAKRTCKLNGRQLTIKRFGWSDTDQVSAQQHADSRLKDAIKTFESGFDLKKSEPKIAYNGAYGVPIREEIVSRHGDIVITRNGYGSLCLNTPDVLFGDIDFSIESGYKFSFIIFGILLLIISALTYVMGYSKLLYILLIFSPVVSNFIYKIFNSRDRQKLNALNNIRDFSKSHPEWHLITYSTPMGFRILVTHKTFDPRGDEVEQFFKALNNDPIYQRMCVNQNCFRARVSPKPWRIGISNHIRPRPGVWPVNPEKMSVRTEWITEYELKAKEFASCKFVEEIGSHVIDEKIVSIRKIHDDLCKANLDLPIA